MKFHSAFPLRRTRRILCGLLFVFVVLPTLSIAADDDAAKTDAVPDPTRSSARVKAALSAQGSGLADTKMKGIVVAAGKEGTVMLEFKGGGDVLARPGLPFNVSINGAIKTLSINLTPNGVNLEAPLLDKSILLPSLAPLPSTTVRVPGDVDYVEFRELPLLDALRMLSDQTGNNYSASVAANKVPVNAMLRNVSATNVVEEICKSHNLWFKRDPNTGITRIMTVEEFEKELVGYREEQTEVFTLKYPNVPEIATAIADLFGDRVQLSMGADEIDEDARRDLENRFDRFQVLTQGAQSANAVEGTVLGGNANGYGNGTTVAGFGGYGGGGYGGYGGGYNGGYGGGYGGYNNSRYGSQNGNYNNRDRNNRRYNRNDNTSPADDDLFRNLTPEQAERVDKALVAARGAGAADVESLRKRPANIFVSASRRSNMVVVRTADARAMDDIRTLVRRMDRQTPMVLLEVKVVSIDLGKDLRTAFDYQFNNGHTGVAFSQENIPLPLGSGNVVPGAEMNSTDMTFVIVSNNFRARMQLLEEKNRVKTLATPTLLTANNEISRLFLGEERPLVRNITSQTILTDNNAATTPNTTTEFRNVGNTLLITPNINSDRTVTLRLVQENSTIDPGAASIPIVTGGTNSNAVQNVKVDVVATKSVSGTFVAKDGMAIAVGGLIEDDKTDKREQVPVLGDIPGIGLFFRRQEKSKSRSELVVIIRPHVLTTPADGEKVTVDLLKQLAPNSLQRLKEDGFLPEDAPIVPVPKATPVPDAKKAVPPKKKSSGR